MWFTRKEKGNMEPEIKSKPAFTVVGIKYRGKNENNEIPQLWFKLGPRINEIKHRVGSAYGVMDNYDEESGKFDYIAGIEVDSSADIPEGMVSIDVPNRRTQFSRVPCQTLLKLTNMSVRPGCPNQITGELMDQNSSCTMQLLIQQMKLQNCMSTFL
ncbi:MAG: GyrI-like domain-containing protein [Candidatus Methanofastidiosia archaeon]